MITREEIARMREELEQKREELAQMRLIAERCDDYSQWKRELTGPRAQAPDFSHGVSEWMALSHLFFAC